jgi:hypothetical protein
MGVACVENSGLCDGDGSSRLMLPLSFSLQNRRPFGQILTEDLTSSKQAAFSSLKTQNKFENEVICEVFNSSIFHTFGFCSSSQKCIQR